MTAKELAHNPWTIITTLIGVLGTGGTIGGMMGYDHLYEELIHPFTVRMDRQILEIRVSNRLGHTEQEITDAYIEVGKEIFEEKRAARLDELGLSEEDFKDEEW